jgi:hypothetical protein
MSALIAGNKCAAYFAKRRVARDFGRMELEKKTTATSRTAAMIRQHGERPASENPPYEL